MTQSKNVRLNHLTYSKFLDIIRDAPPVDWSWVESWERHERPYSHGVNAGKGSSFTCEYDKETGLYKTYEYSPRVDCQDVSYNESVTVEKTENGYIIPTRATFERIIIKAPQPYAGYNVTKIYDAANAVAVKQSGTGYGFRSAIRIKQGISIPDVPTDRMSAAFIIAATLSGHLLDFDGEYFCFL
jgi:hypothetical protein